MNITDEEQYENNNHLPREIVKMLISGYTIGVSPLRRIRYMGYECNYGVANSNTRIYAGGRCHEILVVKQ